jgi:hypothetical protein
MNQQNVWIDTVPLVQSVMKEYDDEHPRAGALKTESFLSAQVAAADLQWTWIEQTLRASTADYVIATGHFPVFSVGALRVCFFSFFVSIMCCEM